jgi:Recombination endonuclease VII
MTSIATRPTTVITCANCGGEWLHERTPGRRPKYCNDECKRAHYATMLPCSIEGCTKKASNRDPICPMHRARLRNLGNLDGHTPKVCAHCGEEWVKTASGASKRTKYCSDACFTAAMKKQDDERKVRNKPKRTAWMRQARYKLTAEDFSQMFDDQDGCCAICGLQTEKDSTDRKARLYVDHDHSCCEGGNAMTCGNCVRDLLCWWCNSGLGLFKDDPARLRDAAIYLERHQT